MNTKEGMDDHESELCFLNDSFPLLTDTKDQKGERFFLKVDSGIGSLNVQLLCKCRLF